MIIKKEFLLKKELDFKEPIGYEYDSETSSIILLNGYIYTLLYEDALEKDILDLKDYSNG